MRGESEAIYRGMLDSQKRYESRDPTRREVRFRRRGFDRVDFAMRVLAVLKPRTLKVVVYKRLQGMVVETGRQFRHGRLRPYALVGLPESATRHQIAYELARLTGVDNLPYAVTALVQAATPGTHPRVNPYRVS